MMKTQVTPITCHLICASPVPALGFVAQLGVHLRVHLINCIQDWSDPRDKLMDFFYALLFLDFFTLLQGLQQIGFVGESID